MEIIEIDSMQTDNQDDSDSETDFECMFKEKAPEDSTFYFKRIDLLFSRATSNTEATRSSLNTHTEATRTDAMYLAGSIADEATKTDIDGSADRRDGADDNANNADNFDTVIRHDCTVTFVFNFDKILDLSCTLYVENISGIESGLLNRMLVSIGLCALPWYWMGFGTKRIVIEEEVRELLVSKDLQCVQRAKYFTLPCVMSFLSCSIAISSRLQRLCDIQW